MNQANLSTPADERPAANDFLFLCPYTSCQCEMSFSGNEEKKPHRLSCHECKGPFFLDWCNLCGKWNVIPARVENELKCGCRNVLKVTKQPCQLCHKIAARFSSAANPSQYLCSECKQRGNIEEPQTQIELDENNLIAPRYDEKRRVPASAGGAPVPKPAGPRPAVAPVTSGTPAAGKIAGGSDNLESKLDQLIKSLSQFKDSLTLFPDNAKDLGKSNLAKAFRLVELLILGPKDQIEEDDTGNEVKKRRWNNLPTAIGILLEDSRKKLSAEDDESSSKEQGWIKPLWGRSGSQPPPKGPETANSPPDQTGELTTVFEMVEQFKILDFKLLKKLPELFDGIEATLKVAAGQPPHDESSDEIKRISQQVKEDIANWLKFNSLIKETPAVGDQLDAKKHDRDGTIRKTKDPELVGRIDEVLDAGYVFDNGVMRIVLRRPRVVVWSQG